MTTSSPLAKTFPVALAIIALALTGCTAAAEHKPTPTAQPTTSAFDTAWEWCIWANPEPSEVSDGNGGQILQTAEVACERWLDNVGERTFIDQWDEEYASISRCAFFVLKYPERYADEVSICSEAVNDG
ncbi:hypothetical protein LQ757_03885 [Agromyces sp. SYSU K20354]|uniref:hypothetical protein n=1 Tax=Agromyces cavernae TaxID=2898659 RepID=UPI001E41D13F|nr:hypothetical protein [Agromyces cavernae]MCD2441414.1 hypothetical protein [Agromyces cavernae]